MDQLSFASLDHAAKKKRTKREIFLAEMAGVVPWARLEAVIEPHCPKTGAKGGRRAFPPHRYLACGWTARDVGDRVLVADARADAVGVIDLVGDNAGTSLEPVEQCLGASGVMHLSGRDQEADRAAFRVDARVDLRGETASVSAHTTTPALRSDACQLESLFETYG